MPFIAERLGLTATPVASVFRCEHKLWSRVIQRAVVSPAVPRFEAIPLADPDPLARLSLPFPLWVKPVKSYMSYLGFRVGSAAELEGVIARARAELPPFVAPFNRMLIRSAAPAGVEHVDGRWLLAEELMGGRQCCLVFADPSHGLSVAFAANGMPGEADNHRRTQPVISALYEDLALAPLSSSA